MPIRVTCQKCHKRFNVSEEHAGKTGSCPSCKGPIRVPDKEVVIHAPEHFGPKDAAGRAVLKPIEREEVNSSPVAIVGIVGAIIVSVVVAIVLRMQFPQPADATSVEPQSLWWVLVVGATLLAPAIALAGYWFLRNDELEPHRGGSLAIRIGICALLYALLWGGYAALKQYVFGGRQPEMFHFAFIAPVFLSAGGGIALATLDLDFGNGAVHYAFYLLVTVLFCFMIGVPPY